MGTLQLWRRSPPNPRLAPPGSPPLSGAVLDMPLARVAVQSGRPQTPPQEAAKEQLFRRRACPFPASWEAVRVRGCGSHPWGTRLGGSPAPDGTSPRLLPPTQQKPCWGHGGPHLGAWGEPGWTLPAEGGMATRAGPAELGEGSSLHSGARAGSTHSDHVLRSLHRRSLSQPRAPHTCPQPFSSPVCAV